VQRGRAQQARGGEVVFRESELRWCVFCGWLVFWPARLQAVETRTSSPRALAQLILELRSSTRGGRS
jgi:hypothetical protein